MNTDDLIINFANYLEANKRYSKSTVNQYVKFVAMFAARADLITATRKDVRNWRQDMSEKLSEPTIRQRVAGISAFYEWCRRVGYRKDNPCSGVDTGKMPSLLPKSLDIQMVYDSLGFIPEPERNILLFMVSTGLRADELICAKYEHLDNDFIKVNGKGGNDRLVPLPPQLWAMLEPKDEGYIFTHNGQQLKYNWLHRACNKYLGCTPHQLRHTYATSILNNGGSLIAIKDLLGHKTIASTQRYAGSNIEQLKEVYNTATQGRKRSSWGSRV